MESALVQGLSMQQLNKEFELFLHKFYKRLLVLQPEIYVITNITKYAIHLQVTWKSRQNKDYVTYNNKTTCWSSYLLAIQQMKRVCDYALKDAEILTNSPFVELFFGMQPTTQEIENSALDNPIYKC